MTTVTIHQSQFGVGLYGDSGLIGLKAGVKASAQAFKVIHQSEFDAFQNILPVFPSIKIEPKVTASTKAFTVFHLSTFDVVAPVKVRVKVSTICNPISSGSLPVLLPTVQVKPIIQADTQLLIPLRPSIIVFSSIIATAAEVVPNTDKIQFGSLVFQNAERAEKDKITPIVTDKLAQSGVSEPSAFTRVITIRAETNELAEHRQILSMQGQRLYLWVYGTPYANAYISSISDIQRKAGLTRFAYTIEFTHHVFESDNVITYGGLTLSHPTRSAPDDVSMSYSNVPTGAGFSLSKLVPSIKRSWTFECVCEDRSEWDTLFAFGITGSKNTLVINSDDPVKGVYISKLSKLEPRGTSGTIMSYTLEVSQDSGDNPVIASFKGITLPNACSYTWDPEIIQSETVLNDGRVIIDTGAIPKRTFSFSCSSNSEDAYIALYALIGSKSPLIVDGKTVATKAVISSMSGALKIGEGSTRLYTWTMDFKEDTS